MEIQEKTVNLLYTSWSDDNTPIANGYDLPTSEKYKNSNYFDFAFFIQTHLNNNVHIKDERKININKVRVEDVVDNKKYFYVICDVNLSLYESTEHRFPIHKKVIDLIKSGKNINVIFCREHEVETKFGVERFYDKIKELGLDESKIYILNNNVNTKNQISNLSSKINSHKLNFIEYSSTQVLTNVKNSFCYERDYFFMCRNKKPKFHRLCTLLYLKQYGILENTNWSLITNSEMNRKVFTHFLKLFSIREFNHMIKNANFINSVFKYDVYEKPNWFDGDGNFQHQNDFEQIFQIPEEVESFNNAYINIITESNFENIEDVVHPTEKSFRPFFYYQIPIFVASPNHVKYIREKYKFDMFDDLIDHSYDEVTNDKERFDLVMSQINKLNKNDYMFYYQYFRKNKHRFEKNKKILLENFKENRILDLNYFWNII